MGSEIVANNVSTVQNKLKGSHTNSAIDIAKFVLSLFVVAIHTQIFPDILYPWLSMAVPMFFIFSGYLFFMKVSKTQNDKEKTDLLKKYVIRNVKLYLFYFILFLPLTLYIHDEWYSNGILMGILNFVRSVLFSSTFRASWFISAQVIAMILLFFMSKKMNNIVIMIITSAIFVLALLSSSYNWLLEKSSFLNVFFDYYDKFTGYELCHTFPIALFWCSIGKCLAEKKDIGKMYVDIIFVIIGIVLCYLENKYLVYKTGSFGHMQLASLCILCTALVSLLSKIKWSFPFSIYLRNASTIIYASHFSLHGLVRIALEKLNICTTTTLFIGLTLVCIAFSAILLLLEKKIKILKYAH